jgi:glycosyltransferase involved in cell wall biosynthesis
VEAVSLSVLIPMYNEADNVEPLFARLGSALRDWPGEFEILVVDDGSTDETRARLGEIQRRAPHVRVARFRRNLGKTAAMAAGFRLARGRFVVTLDGDLQNDPAEIPRLVAMLQDWDAVCGIRTRRLDSWWRRVSSRIGNAFRNWATGDDIVDAACMLKAFRRECIQNLELYRGFHRFLPTLLKMRGYRVTQVPVGHHPRLYGKSKYGTWGRMWEGLADVWAVRWMQKNQLNYEAYLELSEMPEVPERASPAPGAGRGQ